MTARGFTNRELVLAASMRRNGARWYTVARAIGRRSSAGIRRRLDQTFRVERNKYMAAWRRRAQ